MSSVRYNPRKNVGCGVSELDPPSVSSLLLQRLGDITMFCCADRSTVCEEEPVVESIMLMKGSKKVVIVDTHADAVRVAVDAVDDELLWLLSSLTNGRTVWSGMQASEFGLQFGTVGWKLHLPALKAIGLASLLSSRMQFRYVVAVGDLVEVGGGQS